MAFFFGFFLVLCKKRSKIHRINQDMIIDLIKISVDAPHFLILCLPYQKWKECTFFAWEWKNYHLKAQCCIFSHLHQKLTLLCFIEKREILLVEYKSNRMSWVYLFFVCSLTPPKRRTSTSWNLGGWFHLGCWKI